jgi:hypothetical protein
MSKKKTSLLLGLFSALALVALAAGFCFPAGPRLTTPSIKFKTSDERYATLDALRTAWDQRPMELNADNDKAERVFLNRMIYFLNRTKRAEVYSEACGLWNGCYHDHAERYHDFVPDK